MAAVAGDSRAELDYARQLIALGIPIFTCRLTPEGEPVPPKGWEGTQPSDRVLSRWRPGMGLCAVTGVKYDVLDIDPRNGGTFSANRMGSDLGEDGPELFWKVKTPSGGLHLWIAPLGIGTHHGFMGGLDLKGGRPDGSSRGFVFIPPTVRPSKDDGVRRPYKGTTDIEDVNGDAPCEALREYISAKLREKASLDGERAGRTDPEVLAQACIDAEAGEQRESLLRYTHELERRGYSRSDIVTLLKDLVKKMPTYDEDRPWRERDLRGLLHAPGKVAPDASPGEISGSLRPLTTGLVRPVSSLADMIVEWLWAGYLAFRELTVIDGEKAVGKTLVVLDVAARATRGRAMPGQPESICDPQKVLVFGDEGHIESVTKPRLLASDADMDMVYIPSIKVPKRGDRTVDWNLALPGGAPLMAQMIAEAGAGLVIWDPITDFLDESIQTHNDASVRRALRPLAIELAKTGAAGLAIRHMNKDTSQAAKYRGSGSMAFQNRARVHVVAVEIPVNRRTGISGRYALAMVDSNLAVKRDGVLTYNIVDSEVPMDTLGNMVGRIKWEDYEDIDVLSPEAKRRGPPSSPEREEASEFLSALFSERPTWRRAVCEQKMKDAGIKISHVTLSKVRADLGIRAVPVHKRGAPGVESWNWTVEKPRIGRIQEDEDED